MQERSGFVEIETLHSVSGSKCVVGSKSELTVVQTGGWKIRQDFSELRMHCGMRAATVNRPSIRRKRATSLQKVAAGARRLGEESSGLMNDLHVWFRSFRVKLSRVVP
jgi:hypothetical protein